MNHVIHVICLAAIVTAVTGWAVLLTCTACVVTRYHNDGTAMAAGPRVPGLPEDGRPLDSYEAERFLAAISEHGEDS